MADATPKVQAVGSKFESQLKKLKEYAEKDAKVVTGEEFPTWYKPDSWTGDPLDKDGFTEPFKREQHEQEFDQAISGGDSPGTGTDLMASQMQGDVLAQMERAFRSRLRTSVRNKVNAAARRAGHGNEQGSVQIGLLGYIERMIGVGGSQ